MINHPHGQTGNQIEIGKITTENQRVLEERKLDSIDRTVGTKQKIKKTDKIEAVVLDGQPRDLNTGKMTRLI